MKMLIRGAALSFGLGKIQLLLMMCDRWMMAEFLQSMHSFVTELEIRDEGIRQKLHVKAICSDIEKYSYLDCTIDLDWSIIAPPINGAISYKNTNILCFFFKIR